MNFSRFFLASCLLLLLATCNSTPSIVWSDEFDYTGLPDSTKWSYDLGTGPPEFWGNNERQFYTRSTENVSVSNGMLTITARHDSTEGMPYSSARITTKNKAAFKQGRIEVRAKLPKGRGTWPAIWMLPLTNRYGGWPNSGEIDIMEHVGHDPGVVHGTLHSGDFNHIKQTQREGKITVEGVSDSFHTYAVEWTTKGIRFFVDEKEYYHVDHAPSDTSGAWPFDQDFFLILNIAVGGNWGGQQGIDDSIWPQSMIVDYVRVYEVP